MKKPVLILLSIFLPLIASADAVEIKGIYYNLVSKAKEAEVTNMPSDYYTDDVNIPDKVLFEGTEYKVTSIGKFAFTRCASLKSVTIPNSVTNIGSYAFDLCTGLTSLKIPNSVTSIGSYAFNGCSNLSSITISSSVTSIEWATFKGCTGLSAIVIPRSVTNIGVFAFEDCSGLTSLTIPNSVTKIGQSAFNGCSKLTSITIPCSVTSIGSTAFGKCEELKDVYCNAEVVSCISSEEEALYTYPNAFESSYPEYITLHVPMAVIENYKSIEPWNSFKDVVAINEGEIAETPKCAKPTISLKDGKLYFDCDTEDAEFISEITVCDAKKHYDCEITIGNIYIVTVFATKPGYIDSEKATLEFTASGKLGDLTGDGIVNVADHVMLSKIILNQ